MTAMERPGSDGGDDGNSSGGIATGSSSTSGSSRPPMHCGGRRGAVVTNIVKMLHRRQIDSKRQSSDSIINSALRFRNIRLMAQYDTHHTEGQSLYELPGMKIRAKVVQIVASNGLVFALTKSGRCAVFSRDTNKKICLLNRFADEFIGRMFYNKDDDSLITTSAYSSDDYSTFECRSTRIDGRYIQSGPPDAALPLFETESLYKPNLVQFDDVNGKMLTYSNQDSIYKVFELKNYTLLYSIPYKDVEDIKTSPGIMLLIFPRAESHVPLKILSIKDGRILKEFNHLLHHDKKVDFLQLIDEKLLVKQENENLQILDVRNSEVKEVAETEFMTSRYRLLYQKQLFLMLIDQTISVWNLRGETVASFEDHELWSPPSNQNSYITRDECLMISFCKGDSNDQRISGKAGSININNTWTGKCVAKINSSNVILSEDEKKRRKETRMVADALEVITALFFDEERNEIYTGIVDGWCYLCWFK